MNRKARGTGAVILSAIMFGVMPLAAKFIYANGSNSMTLTLHRFFFSIPFLWIVMHIKGEAIVFPQKKDWLKLLMVSSGIIATPVLLYMSYSYISTGLGTTLHFVYPVLVLIGGAIFFKQRVDLVRGIVCALCLAGIVAFYTPGGTGSSFGILIALASGFTFASYVLLLDHGGLTHYSPFQMAFYFGVIGTVILFIMNVYFQTLTMNLTPAGWIASILFGIGISGVAVVLFQYGVKQVGAQNTSLLSTFEPVTSVIVGFLLMRERLTTQSGIGIGLILLAIFILGIADRKKASVTES